MKNTKWKNFKEEHEDDFLIIGLVIMTIGIIALMIFMIAVLIWSINDSNKQMESQKQLMENLLDCELVNTNEISIVDYSNASEQVICTRNGQLLIVKKIGIVTDDAGNGKLLNGRYEEKCDYSGIPGGVHKGDVVTTYLVYNPDTDGFDDILMDFNYVTYTGATVPKD